MLPKNAAILLGIVFMFVGVLGFVDNPLIGHDGVFHADRTHNIVHILSGLLFFVAALLRAEITRIFIITFGFIYLLLGLIGLLSFGASGMGTALGLRVNGADNLLHIALGTLILLLGITVQRESKLVVTKDDSIITTDDRSI